MATTGVRSSCFCFKIAGMIFCAANCIFIYVPGSIPIDKENIYYLRDIVAVACMTFFLVEVVLGIAALLGSCPRVVQLFMLFFGAIFNVISGSFCFVIYEKEKFGPDASPLPIAMGIIALFTAAIMIADAGREYVNKRLD
nr:uncharacterized protein LOC111417932 [Onthophagus taurus]